MNFGGRSAVLFSVFCSALILTGCAPVPSPMQKDLYCSGSGGYHTYRIPALVVTGKGALLAFCEGRKNSASDNSDIDMLVRRSEDEGHTWSLPHVVWDDGENTCGNPCAVVDQNTGVIWLLMTWRRKSDDSALNQILKDRDSHRVFVTYSENDGCTWAEPRDITEQVKKTSWTWYATGPGVGIQMRVGSYKGRLLIPCNFIDGGKEGLFNSHVIYSDDRGKSWQLGGCTTSDFTNECQVVELSDGRLMLNMRNDSKLHPNQRAVSLSGDGGMSWSEVEYDPALIEPICQASLIRYASSDARPHRHLLFFSNPATKTEDDRRNLTVRLSLDEGKTWPISQTLHTGPSAYSCLAALPDGSVGCLYEGGNENRYEKIIFSRFSLRWLTQGKK